MGVGTCFYTAPEVRCSRDHGSYDQRADLFSVGVIFFEMWNRPCETLMERAATLEQLEKEPDTSGARCDPEGPCPAKAAAPTRNYPEGFADRVPPGVLTIVNSLLSTDPALRFEAPELLE